jgi:hypothetical protein
MNISRGYLSGAIHALTNSPLVADDQTRTQDHRGNETGGVCANYSCDEKKGDKVRATDPFGSTFLMPAIRTRIYSRSALDRLSALARDVRISAAQTAEGRELQADALFWCARRNSYSSDHS